MLFVAQRGASDADANSPAVQVTPSVATTVLSALPTPAEEATPQPLLASTSVSELLTRYLAAAGAADGPAGWSGHIREVAVGLHTATVRTDLGDSEDDRRTADEIAGVVARFGANASGQSGGAPDIEILGANRQSLATRSGPQLARRPDSH